MSYTDIFDIIDNLLLPEQKIIADFSKLIVEIGTQNPDDRNIYLDLQDDDRIAIPFDVKIEILEKIIFKEYTTYTVGTYKVEVAVGSIKEKKFGIITPEYCFAVLYYDEKCQLISSKFYKYFLN